MVQTVTLHFSKKIMFLGSNFGQGIECSTIYLCNVNILAIHSSDSYLFVKSPFYTNKEISKSQFSQILVSIKPISLEINENFTSNSSNCFIHYENCLQNNLCKVKKRGKSGLFTWTIRPIDVFQEQSEMTGHE